MPIADQLAKLSAAATVLAERGAHIIHACAGNSCFLQLHTPAGLEGLGVVATEDQSVARADKLWFKAEFMGVQITWSEPVPLPAQPISRML